MQYSREVEEMFCVKKGAKHDPAPIPEEGTIAKAGRPVAKLVRVDAAEPPERLGFLVGQAHVPEDFDSMHAEEIAELFGAHE